MTPLEREYRATATRIGCALLVFSALSLIRGAVLAFLPLFCGELSAVGAEITEQDVFNGEEYADLTFDVVVEAIKGKFDVYIISNNHELGQDEPLPGVKEGWNEFDFGRVCYLCRADHTPKKVAAIIAEIEPDVIYQNSFFSYNDLWPVLQYKRKHPAVKVVVAPRGEFYPERFAVGKPKKLAYCIAMRLSGRLRDVYFQGTGDEECRQ